MMALLGFQIQGIVGQVCKLKKALSRLGLQELGLKYLAIEMKLVDYKQSQTNQTSFIKHEKISTTQFMCMRSLLQRTMHLK